MKRRGAFTLVELLVVVAIISVLAALLIPSLASAIEQGRRVVCANNQKQLYLGVVSYAGEFDDCLPSAGGGANGTSVPSYLTGLGREMSMFFWADAYVGVEIAFAATDPWNNSQFANLKSRGPFACPGSRMIADGNINYTPPGSIYSRRLEAYPRTVDYRLCFAPTVMTCAGGWNDVDGPPMNFALHARMRKAAVSVNGYARAFFMDNLWTGTNTSGPYSAWYNGHANMEQMGQNVTAGDGAVKWHEYEWERSASGGHPLCRVPMDYWVAIGWALAHPSYYPAQTQRAVGVWDPNRKYWSATAGYYHYGLREDGGTWPFANAIPYYHALWR